jgi:hypothetical protein
MISRYSSTEKAKVVTLKFFGLISPSEVLTIEKGFEDQKGFKEYR